MAGGLTLAGSFPWNSMNCLLKDNLTSMGRLLMTFWTRCGVREMLWRSSMSWNYLMIFRLAYRVLILGARSSATS